MPHPLTTTLMAFAFLAVEAGSHVVAGFAAGGALWLEITRFWVRGSESAPARGALIKSGEAPPDEDGRTTLLRG